MSNELDFIDIIKENCETKMRVLNWSYHDVAYWLDGVIFALSSEYSNDFFKNVYKLRDYYIEKGNMEG